MSLREFSRMLSSCTGNPQPESDIIPGVNDLPPKYSQSDKYEKVIMINYLPDYGNLFDKNSVTAL